MNDVDRDARVRPGRAHPECHTAFASLRRLLGDERGDTMVEVLLSITLTGIAFGAILGGLAQVSLTAQTHNANLIIEGALSQARRSVESAPYAEVNGNTFTLPAPSGFTVFRAPINPCDPAVATRLCFSAPADLDASALSLRKVSIEASIGTTKRSIDVFKSDR